MSGKAATGPTEPARAPCGSVRLHPCGCQWPFCCPLQPSSTNRQALKANSGGELDECLSLIWARHLVLAVLLCWACCAVRMAGMLLAWVAHDLLGTA